MDLIGRASSMEIQQKQIPQLRFPDFFNNGEWDYVNGNELFEPIVNKNHNSDLPVLAITQDQGAVPRDMIDYNVIVSDKSIAGYKVVEVGDFIISLRSFQGGIEYSYYKGLCSPAYIVLRRKNELICNDFYRHYFKSARFIQDLNRNLEGIRDGKMVSYQQFSTIRIPFPPLAEQRRIAACLSALDEMLAATNGKLERLKTYKKGLMQKLFPAKGKKLPELRFKEFEKDGEWEEKKVSEIFHITRGYVLPTSETKNVPDGEYKYPVYSSQTANNGLMGFYNKALFKDAITWTTDGANAGTVRFRNGEFYCTNVCGVLISDVGYANPCIAEIIGAVSKKYVSLVGNPKLMNNVMAEIPILVPSLAEQRKIADCLTPIDEVINLYTNKVTLLELYKKGLMQQLFPTSK